MRSHIEQWKTQNNGYLSRDANGDLKTDYARWRLVDDQGRQSWRYLESDDENEKWPQTVYDKYYLGLDTGLSDTKSKTPLQAAHAGVSFINSMQLPSGQWASECSGPLFNLPITVIAWYVTDTPIPAAHAVEMRRYVFARQNVDGGWGWHVEAKSLAIGTVLNYVVLRLLGASEEDPRLIKARGFLHSLGGATFAPGVAKFWLSVLGVMKWECVNPFLPEFWQAPDSDPMSPRRWYIATRTNFTSMSYIYSKGWSYPVDPITQQLRDELYTQPYDTINFAAQRNCLAETDNIYPKWWLVNMMNWLMAAIYVPYLRKNATKESAEQRVWELVKAEDKNTEFMGLSSLSKSANFVASYIHDGPESDLVKGHRETMSHYFWMKDEGMAGNLLDGIQVWDTTLLVQALIPAGPLEDPELQQVLTKAHGFLADQQLQDNVEQQELCYRWPRKGGWPFSTKYQGYMLSECTGEGLRSILQLQETGQLEKLDKLPLRRLQDAVDCMLTLQNDTGGFAVYEKRQGSMKLAWLEMGEFSGKTMVTYDYVESTTAVVSALVVFIKTHKDYRYAEIQKTIKQGLDYIKREQKSDGGWYAVWGVCFTYGGMFALETLALVGETYSNSESSRKGCEFLLSKQKEDGGWGESYLSFQREQYVDHDDSQVSQTAWVCMGLMHAECPDKEAIRRGIKWIMSRQLAKGDWLQQQSEGGVAEGVMTYSNYKLTWPVRALAEYARRFGDEEI